MTRAEFMAPVMASVKHPPCLRTLVDRIDDIAFRQHFARLSASAKLAAKRMLDFREATERMETA